MLGGRPDIVGGFDFDGWCSETGRHIGIKEKMGLGMPFENWQCHGRRNMGGQLIKRRQIKLLNL